MITRVEKATMMATIHNEPEFSELFMSYLLTRHIEALNEPLIEVQPVQVGLLCRFQLGVPPENGKAAQC